MSNDTAISVQCVGKAYRIWETPAARLMSPLLDATGRATGLTGLRRKAARGYRDFHALRDISFEVQKGESVGIIGRNGSGKSTLLQIIAGTMQPTTGTVRTNGRVAALLELGSGFNPEFTGRENVFLNGAVLGLDQADMQARFDSIAAFADIGEFIEQPVKTYSSGMMIRLAFAVATAVDPEILIVDEALSVGDVFFQQKCFQRVRQMLKQGTSLLFVSHDTGAVQTICTKALFLREGTAAYWGDPKEAATRYFSSAVPLHVASPTGQVLAAADGFARQVAQIRTHSVLGKSRNRHGSKELELVAASICDDSGNPTMHTVVGGTLRFSFLVRARRDVAQPHAGINLYDRFNTLVFAASNHNLGYNCGPVMRDSYFLTEFTLTFDVQPGDYSLNLMVSEEAKNDPNAGTFYDVCEGIGPLSVVFESGRLMPFYGVARLPMTFDRCEHFRGEELS